MKEIFHRTSIRKYTAQPVEKEKIEQLLRAAMAAPSARNQQPWEFYVVTDREALGRLAECSQFAGMLREAPLERCGLESRPLKSVWKRRGKPWISRTVFMLSHLWHVDIRRRKKYSRTGTMRQGFIM